MNLKITEGNWYANGIHIMREGNTHNKIGQSFIRNIPCYENKFSEDQESLANAVLMAAAPKLLENLERIIDRIEENGLQNEFPSAYKRAKKQLTELAHQLQK